LLIQNSNKLKFLLLESVIQISSSLTSSFSLFTWEKLNLNKNYILTLGFFKKFNLFLVFFKSNFIYFFNQITIRFFGLGFFYIYYTLFIMYIDACLTDDEPLWEPIE